MNLIRFAVASTAVFATGAALAHPGHVAEQAGHSHWITYGAAGLAVLITLAAVAYGWRRLSRRVR